MTKRLYHLACNARCEPPEGDAPPDPDRWGNRRVQWTCVACGARCTVLVPKMGAPVTEEGFAYEEDIEWTIDLPA